nr:GNAT family N-acetyltransferase [Paracoccus salsus]
MSALHRQCFTLAPRPWSADEFSALIASPGAFLLVRGQGFLLGRVILDEAELLTLAVASQARRQGLGRTLAEAFAATSRRKHAETAFLEVAESNHSARALYGRLGWCEAGRRPQYYGPGLDALILKLAL